MKNSQATFQWMMNHFLWVLAGVEMYIDDSLGGSYISAKRVFNQLRHANCTINLEKCYFCQADQGENAGYSKVPSHNQSKRPDEFCNNFSNVASPLMQLLKKVKFDWLPNCYWSFDQIKTLLGSDPVFKAPEFTRPFSLVINASNHGIGTVLLWTDIDGNKHPTSYFSNKFNTH